MWLSSSGLLLLLLILDAAESSRRTTTSTAKSVVTKDTASATECPGDWIKAEGLGCFKLVHEAVNLSWAEAQLRCEAEGGYLAQPKTASQAEFLYGLARLTYSFTKIAHWWLGLTDLGNEGLWTWAHGHESLQPEAAEFWGPRRPNNTSANSDDCSVMVLQGSGISNSNSSSSSAFYWEDRSCIDRLPTVDAAPLCQRDLGALTTEVKTPAVSCPPGWAEFGGHCYQVRTTKLYWQQAEDDCKLYRGGHLASVHSEAEAAFVEQYLEGPFWIGGQRNSYADFVTWSDSTVSAYKKITNPAYYGGPCLKAQYGSGWQNMDCHNMYPYICKI